MISKKARHLYVLLLTMILFLLLVYTHFPRFYLLTTYTSNLNPPEWLSLITTSFSRVNECFIYQRLNGWDFQCVNIFATTKQVTHPACFVSLQVKIAKFWIFREEHTGNHVSQGNYKFQEFQNIFVYSYTNVYINACT